MLIGTPRFDKVTLHMGNGRDFTIRREGNGIYVHKAMLNGQLLEDMSFAASRMMQGGELALTMGEKVCVD